MAKNDQEKPKQPTSQNTQAPSESKKSEAAKEEVVSLPKSTLEAILSRLESTEEGIKKLADDNRKKDEQIEMLTSISDKGRLAKWQEQNKGTLIRTAKVSIWDNVPVLAWETVKDEVGFRDGRLIVNQIIRLYLDQLIEGKPKTVDLDYLYWSQNAQSEIGEVVEKSQINNREYYTLELKDGRKVKLDVRFINAF